MRLVFGQPLDLATTLHSGQVFGWRWEEGWWNGTVGGHLVLLRRRRDGIEYRTSLRPARALGPVLWRFLRLEDDLTAIQEELGRDPLVAEAIASHPGLRLLRQDPWECLTAFICSTHSNIPRIAGIMERLSVTYGAAVTMGGLTRHGRPGPEALAEAGEARLRELGLGYRARYLAGSAAMVASGQLDLEALRDASYTEAHEALRTLPGVGEKVADCVLLFSLDKLEAFPIDRWVRRAMEEWYLDGRKLSYQALEDWAQEHFGPLAGYAQQYLFYHRREVGRGRPG